LKKNIIALGGGGGGKLKGPKILVGKTLKNINLLWVEKKGGV